ncbi:hypothetical protein G7Y89_g3777 [Cudoniella acicularis]|uniref:BTB domain-containing protein n=1 Tax=Cudoniella acicularis TaxID=354080 RepID=A0A8H4RSR9_9HELO|nr:hypothetical protein G7Y89_g3777 [Cudoniella acicularis]
MPVPRRKKDFIPKGNHAHSRKSHISHTTLRSNQDFMSKIASKMSSFNDHLAMNTPKVPYQIYHNLHPGRTAVQQAPPYEVPLQYMPTQSHPLPPHFHPMQMQMQMPMPPKPQLPALPPPLELLHLANGHMAAPTLHPAAPAIAPPQTATPRPAANRRSQSIEKLLLTPVSGPNDGVNVIVTSGGKELVFTVHRMLLSHFSPVFAKHLEVLDRNKAKVKSLKVKASAYVNELDWESQNGDVEGGDGGEQGAITDKDNKDGGDNKEIKQGRGDEHKAEDRDIEVNVVVRLPSLTTLPKIHLPEEAGEVSKDAMAAFIEWLYCGPLGGSGAAGPHVFPSPVSGITATTLVHLWVLAKKLQIPSCMNDCIQGIEMRRRQTNIIETAMVKWIYDNTEVGCGLRELLVDQCAWVLDGEWLVGSKLGGGKNEEMFPREFLVDLCLRTKKLLSGGTQPGFLKIEERAGTYWTQE